VNEITWVDYITAVGSILTPILVLFLTTIGWFIKSNLERKVELENKLRDDRIETYNQILEPFIILLTSDEAWSKDKKYKGKDKGDFAMSKMLSFDYRKTGFKLSLMGSDPVVKAYIELMQFFYRLNDQDTPNEISLKEMLELLGTFLLEIRKSMGNEATMLDSWNMCEWWMSDARKIKNGTYEG